MKELINFRYLSLFIYTGIVFGIVYNRDYTDRSINICIAFLLLTIKIPIHVEKKQHSRGYKEYRF
jgi:hypothetical protein